MSEEEDRQKTYGDALQQLLDLTDAYFTEKGRHPSLVRVGVAFGRAILEEGASRGLIPNFQVKIDETLGPDEVVMEDEPRSTGERQRPTGGFARNRTLPEIVDIIEKCFKNRPYEECYVGITSNVERRLFVDHKVSSLRDVWIAVLAVSHAVARNAQRFFLDVGMDGDLGSGDETATIVYAYRKTPFTEP